jgi:hypothetical protein
VNVILNHDLKTKRHVIEECDGTRAADTFAAGAPEGERLIDLVLDLDQRIQDHWSAGVEIDFVSVDPGILARLRV